MTSMTPPVAREYPAFPSKKRERSLSCSADTDATLHTDPAPKKARTGAVKAAVLADPVAAVRKSSLPSRKRERSLSSSPTTDIALHTPDPAAKKARTSATATDLTNPVINIPPEDTTETGFRIGPARNDPRHPADNKLHMDPADVRKHFDRIGHFRILVIGRANAGKTTLLQRLSNSIELPEIFNSKGERINPTTVQGSLERGYHNIDDELIFRSNPGFIFHDSRGFETGSEDELKMMKDFLTDRAATMKLDKRIHAVWFCIPLTDHGRSILTAEELFFNECNTANVPVIVVLTKADAMRLVAIGQLKDAGFTMKQAKSKAGELTRQLLREVKTRIENELAACKYPPNDYLLLSSMHQDSADCNALLQCTTNALDQVKLQQLLISTQQVNFVLNCQIHNETT